MKILMRSTLAPRLLALTLVLSLLLIGASLPAHAESADADEERAYMTWNYSERMGCLIGYDPNTETTIQYSTYTNESSIRLRYSPVDTYYYANTVEIDGESYTVSSPYHGAEVVEISDDYGTTQLLFTNTGKTQLNALYNRFDFTDVRLTYGTNLTFYPRYCAMDENYDDELRQSYTPDRITMSLFDLRSTNYYEVLGFDEDGWVGIVIAFIYEMDDGLYYLRAADLSNDCFEADGSLLPKESVTVSLYPLSEEMSEKTYDGINDITYHYGSYSYEDGGLGFLSDPETEAAIIYITVVVLGILLPIAPLVVGLCLPHSQKLGYKKRWYALAIMGGAWLILGILVLALMVIAL